MNERKQQKLIGWSAIVLFTIGTLGTVLMFLAMKSDVPLEQNGKAGLAALAWKSVFGIFPSLFLNAAFLFLGARLFIKGGTEKLFQNLAGCVALAVALSIFFGSLSSGAGGWIGQHTGEVVTSRVHIAVGALVGLVAVFAAAWFAWLRQSSIGRPANAPMRPTIEPVASPKPAPRPLARPVATRISTPKTAASEEGVTADESAALFPLEEALAMPTAAAPVSDPVHRADAIEAAPAIPRSPYPEDLRRKGQIPPGAKPLEPASTPQTSAPAAYRWTAPRSTDADATAQPTSDGTSQLFEAEAGARGLRPLRRVEDEDDVVDAELEPEETPVLGTHARDEAEDALHVEALETEPAARAGLPAPSWEQPALFRPEAGDEEPVDAYGTPLTLVEKLRQARRIAGLERADADVVEDLAGERDEIAVQQPAVSISSAELDELMESSQADVEDLEEEEDEIQPARAHAIPREIDEQDSSDFDVDEEDDEEADDDVTIAEDLEEDELEEEDEAVLVGVGSESIEDEDIVIADAEDEDLVTAAAADEEIVTAEIEEEEGITDEEVFSAEIEEITTAKIEDMEADAEDVEDDVDVVVPAIRASSEPTLEPLTLPVVDIAPIPRAEPIQPGLFDAPAPVPAVLQPKQTAAAQSKPTPQRAPEMPATISAVPSAPKVAPAPKVRAPNSAEKEVVLQPAAPSRSAKEGSSSAKPVSSVKSTSADTPRPKVLSEIGCLFIERGRVAVSMLQRQYGMDFDEACKVLDDLQEMGLIGPYLGGQRRDILLTRERWLERVSQAGAAR